MKSIWARVPNKKYYIWNGGQLVRAYKSKPKNVKVEELTKQKKLFILKPEEMKLGLKYYAVKPE